MNPFNIMQQASQAAAAFSPHPAATQSSHLPAGAPSLFSPLDAMQQAASALNPLAAGATPAGDAPSTLLNPLATLQQAAQSASALNPLNVVEDVAKEATSALNPLAAGATPAAGAPSLLNPLASLQQAAQSAGALNPLKVFEDVAKEATTALNPLAAGATPAAGGSPSLLNPLGAVQQAAEAASALNPLNALGEAAKAASSLNPLAGGNAASLLNPMNALEQAMASGGGALNPATMIQDMIKQAITAYLSQILPPALVNILKNPFSISSYAPLIKKLVDWVGKNPYRILLVVTIGMLLMVVVVAVLAFMTFFFTATASAVFIILAGILFVTASTVAMTLVIIKCSTLTAIVWKMVEKGAPAVKNILSEATGEISKVIGEGKDLLSKK